MKIGKQAVNSLILRNRSVEGIVTLALRDYIGIVTQQKRRVTSQKRLLRRLFAEHRDSKCLASLRQ